MNRDIFGNCLYKLNEKLDEFEKSLNEISKNDLIDEDEKKYFISKLVDKYKPFFFKSYTCTDGLIIDINKELPEEIQISYIRRLNQFSHECFKIYFNDKSSKLRSEISDGGCFTCIYGIYIGPNKYYCLLEPKKCKIVEEQWCSNYKSNYEFKKISPKGKIKINYSSVFIR